MTTKQLYYLSNREKILKATAIREQNNKEYSSYEPLCNTRKKISALRSSIKEYRRKIENLQRRLTKLQTKKTELVINFKVEKHKGVKKNDLRRI